MNLGQVRYLACGSDLDYVAQSDSKIFPDNFVHSYLAVVQLVIY